MKKTVKMLAICLAVMLIISCAALLRDYVHLHQNVLRLHVVAASDSENDQRVKLLVRDRVLAYLNGQIPAGTDKETAQLMISQRLDQIREISEKVLSEEGVSARAEVTLTEEAFPVREYETFSLPAGIYDSLRIRIGDAQGQNWWCVIFPSLCIGATSEGFESTAAGAGFSSGLTNTIAKQDGYEIRFFLLDCLGRLENLLRKG